MKYAASLDQDLFRPLTPETSFGKRNRPPLQHGTCFDLTDYQCSRYKSCSKDDETPDTPSGALRSDGSEDRMTSSFDFDAEVFRSGPSTSFSDKIQSSYERNYKNRQYEYFYGAGSSSDYESSMNLNDPLQIQRMSVTALFEKFCADEREALKPQPIRQASETCFRTNRLRGISSDRLGMFSKKRGDRMSTSSLGDQPGSGSCFSIFDKRKKGKLEKSKRLSASALYDQSPNGKREVYKKFSSDELKYDYDTNVPSTSKSDNSVSKFRFDENPLDRASVAKLYEKFCYDPTSEEVEEPKSAKFSAISLSERTSDIMNTTIMAKTDTASDTKSELMSPERSASNTIQLIFEEPRSNRTSLSDLYEPCFSINFQPKRPSIKANRHWDWNSLDLRAIDDESPSTSKFTSVSTPEEQVFDTRSNNSDVFDDKLLEDIHEGDSIEDDDISCKSDQEKSKTISSRPSMHKLQPILFRTPNNQVSNSIDTTVEKMSNLTVKTNCEVTVAKPNKLLFRIRKVKQIDDVAVNKRTRCFPL